MGRQIFFTIPRLLHTNQEGLPGYFDERVPSGILNFTIHPECQIHSENLFPRIIIRRNENLDPVIHSILLMGSVGSIAQTQKSDLDYTLLVDKSKFTAESLQLFKTKLKLIEEWTWKEHHLETHFFINDYHEVKNNIFGESDSESTGSALAKLLKEEMYRTMILLTGKIPFWWVVPVATNDEKYEGLLDQVNSGHTVLNREEFIDIGNVENISDGEFFGGSIWTLIKSFQSPFKTLMKMGLLEDYMFNKTQSNLLCHEIKRKVFSNIPHPDIDPYILLFERVQNFFNERKTNNEVDALRTAFYLKVGTLVRSEEYERGTRDPKKSVIIKMLKKWGWTPSKLLNINNYSHWQMMQKVALGNRINKILMNSYKIISEKSKTLNSHESLISEKDTHLLGRKLFSFYRKTPNKVENLFSLIDGNTAEKELTFLCEHDETQNKDTWYLIRGRNFFYIEQVNPENIIKKANTLPFLIAFTSFNGLFKSSTQLLIRAPGQSIKETDIRILLSQLAAFIAQINIAAIANEDLLSKVRINKLYMIIDFGNPLPREILMEDIKDCKSGQQLTQFINKRIERIKNITAIYLTSWGELFCKTYRGWNCLDHCMDELSPHIPPVNMEDRNFLRVYIPTGQKEILQIPWLNNYLFRSMKLKRTAVVEQAAN